MSIAVARAVAMLAGTGGGCRGRCRTSRRLVPGDGAHGLEEVCVGSRRGNGRFQSILLLDEVGKAWVRALRGQR